VVILALSALAGVIGSLLGLGGGIIVVPMLTLIYGVPIHQAVAVSLMSIVVTSSAASATFTKGQLTNIRVGIFLEMATVVGALVGFLFSKSVNPNIIFFVFSMFLFASAFLMLRKTKGHRPAVGHPFSEKMGFHSSFTLPGQTKTHYKVDRPFHALVWMFGAGILSSLLGIGAGVLKVLAMDGYMRLPVKVSSATSNFMIGITAAAGGAAYLMQGDIRLDLVAPVAIGIMAGSYSGSRVLPRLSDNKIRYLFVVVISIIAIQMLRRAFNG
jgi:uncharacterized protein